MTNKITDEWQRQREWDAQVEANCRANDGCCSPRAKRLDEEALERANKSEKPRTPPEVITWVAIAAGTALTLTLMVLQG